MMVVSHGVQACPFEHGMSGAGVGVALDVREGARQPCVTQGFDQDDRVVVELVSFLPTEGCQRLLVDPGICRLQKKEIAALRCYKTFDLIIFKTCWKTCMSERLSKFSV